MADGEFPKCIDWSFAEIQCVNSDRATCLEAAGGGDELLCALEIALREALDKDTVRYGVDGSCDNPRVIIQFRVGQAVYDWFYSARTGYRAHFWASPETGITYNSRLVKALLTVLDCRLPKEVSARKIEVHVEGASREERDCGPFSLSKELIFCSLEPRVSKIWIGERLIRDDGGNPRDTLALYIAAQKDQPKLGIPRWRQAVNPKTCVPGDEGLRSPYPEEACCWLDLKGGFVGDQVYQIKSPSERAEALHKCGWT